MMVKNLFAIFLLVCFVNELLCKNARYSSTVESAGASKNTKKSHKSRDHDDNDDNDFAVPHKHKPRHVRENYGAEDDNDSIEDVDDDKVDDIIEQNEKNLVILFYEKESKCPQCKQAVSELEEIDDDLESTGFIEVVKSHDRKLARDYGIFTFPALLYFRRKHPILYDDDFDDSEQVLKWIRARDEVVTVDLDDANFEDKTDSHSPSEGALDWFVMFYDSKNVECNSYVSVWETVAHKLRGMLKVGKLDIAESDDVADRFNVNDEDDCPTFFLFRKGKMYRYKDTARDVKSFTNFALHKYKDQRGRRVPEPPTIIEELYEGIKEDLEDVLGEHYLILVTIAGCLGTVALIGLVVWLLKSAKAHEDREEEKKDS